MNALKAIKKELDEQRVEIRETGINVTEQVTLNISGLFEEKFLAWEGKLGDLEQIVENQEKRIYYLEKQARVRNLVFFGIEEKETSYDSFEKNIVKWLEQHLSIKLSYSDIQEIKRVGKKGERPRPTLVTFSTLGTKIKILKQKSALKGTLYYVDEDYPKYVQEKRKELREQLKLEREKGNKAVIKYDKLIISKNSTKRKLPTSPGTVTARRDENTTQVTKKNKFRQSNNTVNRSNSISEGVIKPGILNYLVNKTPTTADCNQNEQA